jgi:hypothetical protein
MPRSSTDPARGISSGSEVGRLREDMAVMLAVATARAVLVHDDLRERLSLGARGLPATRMLRDELAAIVRPAG